MEHLQSCPLLVLFMQIHDLASVGHFGQKLSSRKHFAQSLKHFSSLLCLQSHFLAVSINWCPLTWAAWISHSEILEAYILLPIFDGNIILFLCAYMLKYHLVQPPSHCLFNILATTPSNLHEGFFFNYKFLTSYFLSSLTKLVSANPW